MANQTLGRCMVEERLTGEQVLELDLLLADPQRWPKALFEGWQLPSGSLPATMRSWGAIQLGIAWCEERGIPMPKRGMQHHYDKHVVVLPYTPDDLVVRGEAESPVAPTTRAVVPAGPSTYIDLYRKGIAVGIKALDLLLSRVEKMEQENKDIPIDLLMNLGNLGTKLATSQAGIVSRGFDLARQKEEELEGFRAGSAPEVSPRFGDHRVRVIEGEARPIVDRGRADRRAYNERAEQDGSPPLPA